MTKNCKDYKNCINNETIINNLEQENDIKLLLVGCWGVFCQNGLNNFKKEFVIYGQQSVSRGMIHYTKDVNKQNIKVHSLILAGDNIYADDYNVDNMNEQISEGILNCLKNLNVETIYIGIGNHDIINCDILNTQINAKVFMNSKNFWNMPSLYYNIVYKLKNYSVNILMIDVNLFNDLLPTCEDAEIYNKIVKDIKKGKSIEKKPTKISDTRLKYIKTLREEQITWMVSKLKEYNSTYNIIVGHSPIIANGHSFKKDKNIVEDKNLEMALRRVLIESGKKIHAYFSADEHNMQVLTHPSLNFPCFVAGSGGTNLDKKFYLTTYANNTHFLTASHGFVSLNLSIEKLTFDYFIFDPIIDDADKTKPYNERSKVNLTEPAFSISVDKNVNTNINWIQKTK